MVILISSACLCLGIWNPIQAWAQRRCVYLHTWTFAFFVVSDLTGPTTLSRMWSLGPFMLVFSTGVEWWAGACAGLLLICLFDYLKMSVLPLQLVGSVISRIFFLALLLNSCATDQVVQFIWVSVFSAIKWEIWLCLIEGRRVTVLIIMCACSRHVMYAQLLFKIMSRRYSRFVLGENTMYLFSFMFNFSKNLGS